GLLLYIPSLIWFLFAVSLWQFKAITKLIKAYPRWLIAVLTGVLAVMLLPLLLSFVNDPELIRTWLGLPVSLVPLDVLKRLVLLPVFLVARGPVQPIFNLGALPLLDVFATVLLVLGVYWYYFRLQLLRTQLLILL